MMRMLSYVLAWIDWNRLMAVDLQIHLTDTEQAKVSEWIDLLKPGLTNVEKRTLMEALARRLLRDELLSRVSMLRTRIAAQADQADREVFPADDPFAPVMAPSPLETAPVMGQNDLRGTRVPRNPSESA